MEHPGLSDETTVAQIQSRLQVRFRICRDREECTGYCCSRQEFLQHRFFSVSVSPGQSADLDSGSGRMSPGEETSTEGVLTRFCGMVFIPEMKKPESWKRELVIREHKASSSAVFLSCLQHDNTPQSEPPSRVTGGEKQDRHLLGNSWE